MELVTPEPHVRSGGGERVFLIRCVVSGRAGECGITDVAIGLELAKWIFLSGGGERSHGKGDCQRFRDCG